LVNIFSAGNTAVIKPSEKCPATSKLIKKLTSKYFHKDVLLTVEGDYRQSIKLIEKNFDHIFFTGSSETGKSIMKLASKNLTPLTLELSGTNPVIIFKNANLEIAAKRIVWGKFFNFWDNFYCSRARICRLTVSSELNLTPLFLIN